MHTPDTKRPRLFLSVHCGCRSPLHNVASSNLSTIEKALRDINKSGHGATITGSLSLQRCDNPYSVQSLSDFESSLKACGFSLQVSCGDGFYSDRLAKAEQHLLKERTHKMQIYGRRHRSSSNRKKRDRGVSPDTKGKSTAIQAVPHTRQSHTMAVEGVKGR